MRQIGEKTFCVEDQELFAQISCDRNPMHMDPVAARRLIAGRQVVHGIHILLTALEYWQNDTATPPVTISCIFNNTVSVGEQVVFTQFAETNNQFIVQARVKGLLCSAITFTTGPQGAPNRAVTRSTDATPGQDNCFLATLSQPLDEAPEFHLGKSYALKLNDADFSVLFPESHRYLGKQGFASTAALSYVVGMVCPGLHSVFSSLNIDLHPVAEASDCLYFSVRKYDPRFHLFDVNFSGCIQGGIKAFMRPPPQAQPTVQELSKYVGADEFKGSRSLIIGGSRGLGEVTAKVLAAGGGEVLITYACGLEDARAISDEINQWGRSLCQIRKLDLTTDPFASVDFDWNALNAIYFFATPKIFRKKVEVFEPALFQEFYEFYVEKFYELCVFLEKTITTGKIKVYVPSTVAVEKRPKGMAEYAMAKSAAEILIQEINRDFHKLSVFCTQLPRLSTDQTTTILKVSAASNVETLLPLIRSMQT